MGSSLAPPSFQNRLKDLVGLTTTDLLLICSSSKSENVPKPPSVDGCARNALRGQALELVARQVGSNSASVTETQTTESFLHSVHIDAGGKKQESRWGMQRHRLVLPHAGLTGLLNPT
jgi:hypothetical protein